MDNGEMPDLSAEERAEVAAQLAVVSAAWAFLEPLIKRQDLGEAWPQMTEGFRRLTARWWVDANREQLESHDYVTADLPRALSDRGPDHEVWQHFQRVALRDRFGHVPPAQFESLGIGAHPRVLGLDLEILYIHLQRPGGGLWQPDDVSTVIPLVMRNGDGGWLVDNYGVEEPAATA